MAAEFKAAHARHHDIRDHQVGKEFRDLVPGILAVGGDFNLVPLALEKHLEVGGLGATVFGD
jgi:hypothetical protein